MINAAVTLRAATLADLDYIVEIQDAPSNRRWIMAEPADAMRGYLGASNAHLMILVSGKARIGFCLLRGPSGSGNVELKRLALKTPGQGHGRAVIAAIMAHVFDKMLAHKLFFDVAADNARARRAYESMGFQQEGLFRRHWHRRSGDVVDLAYYGVLRSEYAG